MDHYLQNLFFTVLNMNITASCVILFVVIVRLFLKKAPKIFSYSLWIVVMFRLMSPFSFCSAISFLKPIFDTPKKIQYIPLNVGNIAQPKVQTDISGISVIINKSVPSASVSTGINPIDITLFILSIIWFLGILIMVSYGIISYIMLKKKVSCAMLVHDDAFECEKIKTPFVLGIIKPKIYLPIGLVEEEKKYILKHEQIHIKRFDYIIKLFAFLLLCIHWFNPLVWMSFILMSNDMEMSCDEKVIEEFGNEIKKEYSRSLLSMAVDRKFISGSSLAFGENNIKRRIKNVLKYKQPAFWILCVGVVVIVVVSMTLISNPIDKKVNMEEAFLKDEKLQKELNIEDKNEVLKRVHSSFEDSIKTILSSPLNSSNPDEHISAHRMDYDSILRAGRDAENYMLSQFKEGNVKNDLRGQIIMRLCKDWLGSRNNVQDKNLLPTEWYSKLQLVDEITLPDFSYDGADPIEKLVYKTEIEKNQGIKSDLSFLVVAPHIHGVYKQGNKLKVVVTNFAATYGFYGKTLSEQCGSIDPTAITYVKNSDGSYKLDKYEQAKDGDECGPSIEKFCTMPVSRKKIKGLSDKIFKYGSDSNKDIGKLQRDNLIKHLKANGLTGISIREVSGEIVPLT
ncbi:M56 family metallopeptidase [Clostridium scatologenes]|uniref:Peptidase M56 BlaR1 n=1 Tax=Clostridium scatologenes TaxID=1548 RepID=A0A0E3M627_CLOSL|nr:M56 family metallopeptidase [Clostridium scatologenes]AKA68869.1 peptidase M56 BlaR1 [Clostridium scatologenes]